MYAAKYGQLEMVKYLVEKEADQNASYRGNTALHYARRFNHPEIKKYLNKKYSKNRV
jgi:ankyrin repeat protein